MSNDYSPDADDQMPEKKSSQQLLLLLLLLLVVLFGYLYFFTGLIKPRGEQPKPQPVSEAPVKSPLPPRPQAKGTEPAQPAATAVAKTEPPKGAAQPATPVAQPAQPAAPAKQGAGKPAPGKEAAAAKPAAKEAPAAKPAAVATAKPAPAAPQAMPAKTAVPAAHAKGAQPAAQAKVAPTAAAPAQGAKPAATKQPVAKAGATTKMAQKQAAEKPLAAAGKKTKAPARPAAAAYALDINGDLAESEIAPVMAKLKQAGITHVVKTKSQKGEPMHRLFLADFSNRDEALEELERLKLAAPSAFMLKENGRYAVYAGSYMREAKATGEQNRLQGKGVQLLLKSATAPVAVYKMRAGAFADQAGADRAAKALKKAGLSPKVVRLAKVAK